MKMRAEVQDTYICAALVNLGEAAAHLSGATTYIEDVPVVPEDLKKELMELTTQVYSVTIKLRKRLEVLRGGE